MSLLDELHDSVPDPRHAPGHFGVEPLLTQFLGSPIKLESRLHSRNERLLGLPVLSVPTGLRGWIQGSRELQQFPCHHRRVMPHWHALSVQLDPNGLPRIPLIVVLEDVNVVICVHVVVIEVLLHIFILLGRIVVFGLLAMGGRPFGDMARPPRCWFRARGR